VRAELCDAAVNGAKKSATTTPARWSFSTTDTNEWFFIEMNPRIQVEHTVTEVITGIDLVRFADFDRAGHADARRKVGMPAQDEFRATVRRAMPRHDGRSGEQVQPDYGRILTYRSAGGFGVRLDGGMGYAGAVITPFYDSLLVKVTASGPLVRHRVAADGPRLARIPHSRREDEHSVSGKRHHNENVQARAGDDHAD
jgi:pyruvate carboxylase